MACALGYGLVIYKNSAFKYLVVLRPGKVLSLVSEFHIVLLLYILLQSSLSVFQKHQFIYVRNYVLVNETPCAFQSSVQIYGPYKSLKGVRQYQGCGGQV